MRAHVDRENRVKDWADSDEMARAGALARAAVRRGALVRPDSCSWCGVSGIPIVGHHPDYNRPLMVVWICEKCHREHHKRYREDWAIFARAQRQKRQSQKFS